MKKILLETFIILILSGCGKIITVPLEPTPISKEKSTLVIYHDQGFTDTFPVFLDRKPLGHVTSEIPLKIEVEPGTHSIHTEVTMVIDRLTNQTFEKGNTYFFKVWLDTGMWVSSIRTDPVPSITSYTVRSHK